MSASRKQQSAFRLPGPFKRALFAFRVRWIAPAILCAMVAPAQASVAASNGTDTDPLNLAPDVQAAYQHFYDLDYPEAQARFEKIAAAHPTDPIAADYLLNNAIFQELYRLDLLDTTLYVEDGFLSGKHPVVEDMKIRAKVTDLYNHAMELSNNRLQANPNDVDALFARGFATSLETVYVGMVEKKYVAALKMALAARRDDDEVLKLDPKYVLGASPFP
jgi:tetratricopeptide (TPR) repeat protein